MLAQPYRCIVRLSQKLAWESYFDVPFTLHLTKPRYKTLCSCLYFKGIFKNYAGIFTIKYSVPIGYGVILGITYLPCVLSKIQLDHPVHVVLCVLSLTNSADAEKEAAVAEIVLRRFVLLRPLERRQLLAHSLGQRIAWKILNREFHTVCLLSC